MHGLGRLEGARRQQGEKGLQAAPRGTSSHGHRINLGWRRPSRSSRPTVNLTPPSRGWSSWRVGKRSRDGPWKGMMPEPLSSTWDDCGLCAPLLRAPLLRVPLLHAPGAAARCGVFRRKVSAGSPGAASVSARAAFPGACVGA